MSTIDWIFLVLPIITVVVVALYTNRFVKSVADFLAGGRCAGRYLLANARGESDAGLSNTMSQFEALMVAGFVLGYWERLSHPIILLVGISGFIYFRYRETRAMTLAQFLEMRYSRHYRLFMGILAFLSGVLNYGIFPAVSARFFIYFLGLPDQYPLLGLNLSTFATIMGGYLAFTVLLVLFGGQATTMVVDCIEGITSHLIYVVIALAMFHHIGLGRMFDHIAEQPKGLSMLNPFDTKEVKDFNFYFIAMGVAMTVYKRMAVQNKQGFNAAARTPHDARMADVLGQWRGYARGLMLTVLVLSALTFLHHPAYAAEAATANNVINSISDKYLRKQMSIPVSLRYLLPDGVRGLFCAVMVMGLFAGDSGHMHSWGSIFVQDVILPLRKKPLSPKHHILALRLAVVFVAVFAFTFSLLYTQVQYIKLWWSLTESVFVGGAGSAIIGGLYWRRGTTAGAWTASIVGGLLTFGAIACGNKDSWAWVSSQVAHFGWKLPAEFPLNGMQTAFYAACISVVLYVSVSLLTCREPFNLDKMLHRGEYSDDPAKAAKATKTKFRISSILKFDSNFTFWDKMIAGGVFWWSMVLLGINLFATFANARAWYPTGWPLQSLVASLPEPWSVHAWRIYWMTIGIGIPMVLAIFTLVWFGIGGVIDIRRFFRDLKTMTRSATDDGRVDHDAQPKLQSAGRQKD